MKKKPIKSPKRRECPAARKIGVTPRHQPSKAELEEPIHLPGPSPEAVARVIMRGGAERLPETVNPKTKGET